MRKIFAIISTLFFLTTLSAKAEIQFGFGLMAGQLSTDGNEAEGTAADTSVRSKSLEESFIGADLFVEFLNDSGYTVGLSYVPMNFELGSGSRTDVDGSDPAENDNGTRTASADVTQLISLYTNIPVGSSGFYGLLGVSHTTIETNETLNESRYGNADIMGYSVGLGQRKGKFKYELSYTDFEDIALSAKANDTTNKITADADALTFRLSFGF